MEEALAHPYPMIRTGGAIILGAGLGWMLGLLAPGRRHILAGAGFALGVIVGMFLQAPPGTPSPLQVGALIGAIVLEAALIVYVINKVADERERILWILFCVGLHFLPMGLSFGPTMVALGLINMAGAWYGLRIARTAPVAAIGAADFVAKIAAGALMVFAAPRWTFGI